MASVTGMSRNARVTIIQPDPLVPVDRFGPWLAGSGVTVRAVPLWQTDVPALDDLGEGLVVLGGRMSCHDGAEHPWIEPLKDLLGAAVDADVPLLAICLGHQLLAESLGGTVTVDHPDGGEQGAVRIAWTEAAFTDPMLARLAHAGPTLMPQSHRDTVTALPPAAIELARSERYHHQAFRVGSALGVQFHPEASPDLMARWASLSGLDPVLVRREMRLADVEVARNGRQLARAFAGQVRARRAEAA